MPTRTGLAVTKIINGHRWVITIENGQYVGRTTKKSNDGVEVETIVRADGMRVFRTMVCDAS